MASGGKKVKINTRERAVSSDINRLQKFGSQEFAEAMRWLMNVDPGTMDDAACGTFVENVTQGSPLKAEILGGLTVQPQLGPSTSLRVSPGALMMIDPDGATGILPGGANSPDDSVYKCVRDLGVTADGILVLTPNSTGSVRIDVVECSRVPDVILESDNRDIFDPSTGQFTAASVTKVTGDQLTYRIRTGVTPSTFPGVVQGWLPLAVCSVPNGATTWDPVTVWDVRPMLCDRVHGSSAASDRFPDISASIAAASSGHVTGTMSIKYKGRHVGGILRNGTPGTDVDYFDRAASANQSPSFTGGNGLYLVFPFGLPRWSRYTDFGGGARKPRAPFGIPVISDVKPSRTGESASPIPLPASLGFGAISEANAVCVVYHSGLATTIFSMNGKRVTCSPNQTANGTGSPATGINYPIPVNTLFPLNAKVVYVAGTAEIVAASTDFYHIEMQAWGGPTASPQAVRDNGVGQYEYKVLTAGNQMLITARFGIPTLGTPMLDPTDLIAVMSPNAWDSSFQTGGGVVNVLTLGSALMNILGWDI